MTKLSVLGSRSPVAQEAVELLRGKFGHTAPEEADVIVALGGDGFMLQTLHAFMDLNKPVYGMNRGSVGFLMNDFEDEALLDKIENARKALINPLRMKATDAMERSHTALAINEVAIFRQTHQAAKISILIDGDTMMEELICDGILAATPAGSTAYNLSAHGPILPIRSKMMALTPISAFRPRRWRGALLPWEAKLEFSVREQQKRPISATADHVEIRDVQTVTVSAASEIELQLLYDPGKGLEERLMREQFTV